MYRRMNYALVRRRRLQRLRAADRFIAVTTPFGIARFLRLLGR